MNNYIQQRKVLFTSLVVASVLLLGSPSQAAESAKDLLAKGFELRRKQEHAKSLELFQRAHEIEASPVSLAQMGLAEQSLHRWMEADEHLSAALGAATFPWIQKNRMPLEGELAKIRLHIGRLMIEGTAGATVYVNARARGGLPLGGAIRLAEGQATLQVTAPGHQPYVGVADIRGGEETRVHVNLERVKLSVESHSSSPGPQAQLEFAARPPAEVSTWWTNRRIWGVALGGAGVAGVVAGTAVILSNGGRCSQPKPAVCNDEPRSRLPAGLVIGAGVASAFAGSFLLYTSRDVQLAAVVSPSGLAIRGAL